MIRGLDEMDDDDSPVYELICECGERPTTILPTGKRLCPNGHWVFTLTPAGDPGMN